MGSSAAMFHGQRVAVVGRQRRFQTITLAKPSVIMQQPCKTGRVMRLRVRDCHGKQHELAVQKAVALGLRRQSAAARQKDQSALEAPSAANSFMVSRSWFFSHGEACLTWSRLLEPCFSFVGGVLLQFWQFCGVPAAQPLARRRHLAAVARWQRSTASARCVAKMIPHLVAFGQQAGV